MQCGEWKVAPTLLLLVADTGALWGSEVAWRQRPKEDGGQAGDGNPAVNTAMLDNYLKKALPITFSKGRGKDQPLAPHETSKARVSIGALQWPAGQACLQLSASTSIIAANINKGTVDLLRELNKTQRSEKSSADLKLTMRPVCPTWDDMCRPFSSNAAVQVRADSSSQGGFVIILTNT